MSELLAILILGWMIVGMVLIYVDVHDLAEHEATLDELWGDDE